MTVERMREHVAAAYESERWRMRVMHMMPDEQVIAIYHTMLERQQIRQRKKKPKSGERYEQISIFDLM